VMLLQHVNPTLLARRWISYCCLIQVGMFFMSLLRVLSVQFVIVLDNENLYNISNDVHVKTFVLLSKLMLKNCGELSWRVVKTIFNVHFV